MKTKRLVSRWVAGALLAMVFAVGCATGPSGGGHGVDLYFTKLSSFEGASDLSDDSYFWRATYVVDGVHYEQTSYYLVYKSDPPYDTTEQHDWVHPKHRTALQRSTTQGSDLTDFGWYAEITHPPGVLGVYTVCGTQTLITHPPGIAAPVSSK